MVELKPSPQSNLTVSTVAGVASGGANFSCRERQAWRAYRRCYFLRRYMVALGHPNTHSPSSFCTPNVPGRTQFGKHTSRSGGTKHSLPTQPAPSRPLVCSTHRAQDKHSDFGWAEGESCSLRDVRMGECMGGK